MAYSDMVKPVSVGDSYEQLLRVVELPNMTAFGEQIVLSYPLIQYLPIIRIYNRTSETQMHREILGPRLSC